jgi:hypothetical protein
VTGLPNGSGAWPADGQACAMCAVDIAGFTRPDRDEETQAHLRHVLYGAVRESFAASGIGWGECAQQDRGDGLLVIIPPGVPPHVIIEPLLERLRYLIRRHNRLSVAVAQIQVRAALNIGPVYSDENGYSGQDINLLCRMLDARPLRSQLAGAGTDLAVIVSARVHETIVARHPSLADRQAFTHVRTKVQQTRIDAWLYAPDSRSR